MAGRPPAVPSLKLRLTAYFSASALLILVIAGAILYLNLAWGLRAEDAALVQGKADVLRDILQRYPDRPEMLEEELVLEPGVPLLEPYYSRVTDPARGTAYETPGMAAALPLSVFPDPPSPGAGTAEPVRWRSPDGRFFLALTARAPKSAGDERLVQVALNVTHDERVLAGQRRALLILILVGAAISGGTGYLTARRGLRPLEHITAATRRVTAAQLDQRLGEQPWPGELSELAAVFDGMMNRLEDSFTRLSGFAGNLAHELRTPLTNLRGEAEVALSRDRSEPEYRRVLESALEEYDRLATLVDRLLFLARADVGATDLDLRPLRAREELDTVREYFSALAQEQAVEVRCEGEAALVADATLLRRAVANLLGNALQHTPPGGRVVLSVEGAPAGVRLRVTDTGEGIDQAQLPHVFERFHRGDPPEGGPNAGYGLGLALVRSIVELHGGSAEITSEPGVGTSVTLLFPHAG